MMMRTHSRIGTLLTIALLLAGGAARADTYAIWWSPALASQSVDALEEARDAVIDPIVMSNGARSETVSDCAAVADAYSRGFRRIKKGDPDQVLTCRALAQIALAGEAGISSFRDAPVPDFALNPKDVFALPALAGPIKGCAETLIALRSDQTWWSMARHLHVYFAKQSSGPADDGREADSIALDRARRDDQIAQVSRGPGGRLVITMEGRITELTPLGLGDFNGDGLEDLLLKSATKGQPARLIQMTQLKPGTVMSVLDPVDHFRPVLHSCPDIALSFAMAECR